MKKIFHTVTMAALLVAATSCEHKELCLDHAHAVEVEVVFDWRNAPNAAPASMSLYLFPGDGEALRYDFTGRDGGTIRVPIGKYEALCLNSDTENIVYRNTERKGTFEVTTQTSPPLGGLPPWACAPRVPRGLTGLKTSASRCPRICFGATTRKASS